MAESHLWKLRRLGRSKLAHRLVTSGMALLLPHGGVTKIWKGPLQGWKWYRHRDHQFWMPLGLYEEETCRWLESNVGVGSVFFDVGSNAGYFTLLGSKLVGQTGRVVAFEPVPLNVEVTQRQVTLNNRGNVRVDAVAVADRVGKVRFDVEATNANSHLNEVNIEHAVSNTKHSFEVASTSLDDWISINELRPNVVKIDVEGAEVLVLRGAHEMLRSARPRIVLSTHSAELRHSCESILRDVDYDVVGLPGFEHELLGYPRGDSTLR